ncbi:type IV conjugative transfer system coupling protein TraD [Serratia ureilytica]|uniref:type IV conjugative transfer system coupling protein TraD n=1 Tax=Serratia TaxID=613 RepID=UPI0018D99E6E|nr:type IV conjugative transfer system coupling protein TraD [Serratia ureilytica]MBH2897931.1 type IV conjugative transfer system coupling protein TraD [Serratia ureilytica]MBN5443745.1 type IV conjugative transfer system coupling protein TraD [Serratia ureilytica]MBN5443825.1 type IV conjugative transfer system coupling protein TraD [Serratia ureilytica]
MSFNAKDMTQGGQIAFMRLRMFTQIGNLIFYCLFIAFFLVAICTLLWRVSIQNLTNGLIHWWVWMVEGWPSISPSETLYHLDYYGKTLTYTAKQVLLDSYVSYCGQLIWREGIFACIVAAGACVTGFVVTVWILGRQGKQQSEDEITGGRTLTDNPEVVANMLKRDGMASDIIIDGLPLLKNSEVKNFCAMGSVGTGKSRLYRKLMDYARKRGDMVIVYDKSCDFVKDYYDPQYDKILNPQDARCVAWDLWSECLTLPDFENVADILIPMGSNEDPFWQGSARTIFVEAAYRMRNDEDRSYAKLLNTLLSIDLPRLRAYLEGTPAANLVDGKIEKTAISIRSVLTNYAKALRYMQGVEKLGAPFTIRDWMRGVKDNGKNGWLFLTSDAASHKALKPLISMWLSIASHSLLSMGENPDRRVWIFADELPTLHKLPDLVSIVPEARKFGGCFVLGFQTYSQLEDIYGVKAAATLFGVLRTRFLFSVPDRVGAEFAAGEVGEKEYRKASEQYSYGADPVRDGVSVGKDLERMQLVSYSDIQTLPDLCCYVTLPGPYPAVRLQMVYKKVRQVAHPYEPRKIDSAADGRLVSAIEAREAETGNMDALFAAPPIQPAASANDTADAPVSAVSTVLTENPASDVPVVSAAATVTGGQEAELKQKPAPGDGYAERGELPPGISGDGEVVDIAQYEAWQEQQQAMGQQAMQRREETNINIDRHRRELAEVHHGDSEPGDEF